MENLINQANEIEIKIKIYSDLWGPSSDEVKQLDSQLAEINAQILDFMCPE